MALWGLLAQGAAQQGSKEGYMRNFENTDNAGQLVGGNLLDPMNFTGFFGKKKQAPREIVPQPLMWPGEAGLRDDLLGYVNKYYDANENMKNLTPYEEQALGYLEEYNMGGPSRINQMSEQEMIKTLSDGYDPATSPYYAPVIAGIEQRRDQARDRLRRSSQIGGNLTSLSRVRAESDSDTNYEAMIAEMMLNLQSQERQNKLSVLPQAMKYGEYVEETPLRKADATRTIGSIPRDLEDKAIGVGKDMLLNYQPSYYYPQYSNF